MRSNAAGFSLLIPAKRVRRRRCSEEREIVVEGLLVDTPLLLRILQQRLDLGREHQSSVMNAIVEGLDADPVPDQPELARACAPEGEREHPAQAVKAVDPPFLERVQDHLGVGVIGQPAVLTRRLELAPELYVVVDLTVVNEP
jgi:hypothetical protein